MAKSIQERLVALERKIKGVCCSLTNSGNALVQNLQEVTTEGNTTTNNIELLDTAKVTFDNGSRLQKGTTNSYNGGNGGIAQVCSIDYELKWEAGRQYVMQQDGFTIREVNHTFTLTPGVSDDSTKGFVPDSRWILDNGDIYLCTDNTEGAAVWELQVPSRLPGLFAQTADSTPVVDTAVETTIVGPGVGTLTVPANGFSIGDSFTCALDGILSCGSSATLHIRVKTLAGVILADTGIIDMAAATDKAWVMNLYFTIRTLGGATVASISSGGLFSYIRDGGTQFEGYVLSTVNNTTFDTTVNNTLVVTAQWDPGSTGNSITSKNFTLTKVY